MRRGLAPLDQGALLREQPMLDRWVYVEFLRFEALCFATGSLLGLLVGLVREGRR